MPQIIASNIDRTITKDLMGGVLIEKDKDKDYVYIRRDRIDLKKKEGFSVVKDNPQIDVVLMARNRKESLAVKAIKIFKGKG